MTKEGALMFIGVLIVITIGIYWAVWKWGKFKEYTPLGECFGFIDWLGKNEGTWEKHIFETIVSGVVSLITTLVYIKFLRG